jgi:hypothetical protein
MGKLDTVQNGKGSKPRPVKDLEQFCDNWDEIFKKKDKKYLAEEKETCDTPKSYETNSNNS